MSKNPVQWSTHRKKAREKKRRKVKGMTTEAMRSLRH